MTATQKTSSPLHRLAVRVPGVLLCAAAAAIAIFLATLIPLVGSVLIAIVLGALLRNLAPSMPAVVQPGIDFSAKPLLRLGIILLGTKLVLGDIVSLGWGVLVIVVAVVSLGILTAWFVGRWLRISPELSLLIGCGFSICGAAAVAAAQSTLRAKKEDTAAAVALVVLFGTIMIAVVPAVSTLVGLSPHDAGVWSGASTHEVGQVVAVGGILGPEALQPAVVVKLARVLLLAPVIAVLAALAPRLLDKPAPAADGAAPSKRAPLVPLWVLGFAAAAVLRTLGVLPEPVVDFAGVAQTWLLTIAMFALGCGVHIKSLVKLGLRPIALACIVTLVVALVSLVGVLTIA